MSRSDYYKDDDRVDAAAGGPAVTVTVLSHEPESAGRQQPEARGRGRRPDLAAGGEGLSLTSDSPDCPSPRAAGGFRSGSLAAGTPPLLKGGRVTSHLLQLTLVPSPVRRSPSARTRTLAGGR